MKKVITFMAVALLALCVAPIQAQEAQDPFNFEDASNYHLIWLDENTESYWGITDRIVQDLRLNGEYVDGGENTGERFVDIWGCENNNCSYEIIPADDEDGALGQLGNFMKIKALDIGWSSGGFTLNPQPGSDSKVDFRSLVDTDRFHMAVKKSVPTVVTVKLCGGGDTAQEATDNARATFTVGVGGSLTPNFQLNQWNVIDISVGELKDLGWNNRNPFTGYYFTYYPDANGNDFDFDAVFFYRPGVTGIETPLVNSEVVDTQYYTIDGRAVSNPISGLFIAKKTLRNGAVEVEKILK